MNLGLILSLTRQGGASAPTAIEIVGLIAASATSIATGQGVHFEPDEAVLTTVATGEGVSLDEFMLTAEYLWEFSVDNANEDYAFAAVPADTFIENRTAGQSLGMYAAHVYRTAATHEVRLTILRGAKVWQSALDVIVQARTFAQDKTILVDPDGDFTTDAPASDAERRFTTLTAAAEHYSALSSANKTSVAILLRRGKTYSFAGNLSIRSACTLGAFGAGDRPIIQHNAVPVPTVTLSPAFDGVETSFTANQDLRDAFDDSLVRVYLGDDLIPDDHVTYGYSITGDRAITFDTAPPADGSLQVFTIGSVEKGDLKASTPNALFLADGADIIISDIDARGSYDPTNPPMYVPPKLSSYSTSAITNFIADQGNLIRFTVDNVRMRGLYNGASFVDDGTSDVLVISDFDCSEWSNFGIYCAGPRRMCVVGSRIQQPVGALNGPGSKTYNRPNEPIYPDHGPLRLQTFIKGVLSRCWLESRNGWGVGTLAGDGAQPVLRSGDSTPWQGYAATENFATGGASMFGLGAGGGLSGTPPTDKVYLAYNTFILTSAAERCTAANATYSSISNLYVIADSGASDTIDLLSPPGEGHVPIPEYMSRVAPWSINDTIVVLGSRPSATLRLNRATLLQGPQLQNPITGTPVGSGVQITSEMLTNTDTTLTLPVFANLNTARPNLRTIVWRNTTDDVATATRWIDPVTSEPVADYQRHAALITEDAAYTKDTTTHALTLTTGTWTVGDWVWWTRENTYEDLGLGAAPDYKPTAPNTGNGTTPTRFFNAKDEAEQFRAGPRIINPLIVIDGLWGAVEYTETDGTVTDIKGAIPASKAFTIVNDAVVEVTGTFDAFWRPETGNSSIGASGALRALRDVVGAARGAGRTLGAMEPTTDTSDFGVYPVKDDGITVSVVAGKEIYTAGDTAADTDFTVALTGNRGVPPLTLADVRKEILVRRGGDFLPPASSYTVQDGDLVFRRAFWKHPATNTGLVTAPNVVALDTVYVPEIIRNFDPADLTGGDVRAAKPSTKDTFNPNIGGGPDELSYHVAASLRNFQGWEGINRILIDASNGPNVKVRPTGQMRFSSGSVLHTFDAPDARTVTDGTEWVSFVWSCYPANNGTGNVTSRLYYKIGTGAWSVLTSTQDVDEYFLENTPPVIEEDPVTGEDVVIEDGVYASLAFLGGKSTTILRCDVRHSIGIWEGGTVPATNGWDVFFDTNGVPLRWLASVETDNNLGITGMNAAAIVAGLRAFNAPWDYVFGILGRTDAGWKVEGADGLSYPRTVYSFELAP